MTSSQSQDSRWHNTREASSSIPSEPSTPAAYGSEDPFHNTGPIRSGSTSRRNSSSATSNSNTNAKETPSRALLNIDAEDEDVKIAIMALGAMKNLDGKSRSQSEETNGGDTSTSTRPIKTSLSPTRASSMQSSSSLTSTAISSPTSTPGTELTQTTMVSTGSPPKSSGLITASSTSASSSSTPATLADLPPDFQFPAIVHDENGNEMRVDLEDMQDADFLKRVSHLPIVRGTLKAYELGKKRSRVVKYGGDLVESSVKAISRPVVSRLGARLGGKGVEQLDDFACRQLDRIYPNGDGRSPTKEEKQIILAELDEREGTDWKDMSEEERSKRRKAYWALRMEEREREMVVSELRQRRAAQSESSEGDPGPSTSRAKGQVGKSQQQQAKALVQAHSETDAASGTVQKGGWGSMLVEAGVTAGGLSAAMSEESMKSLKYCLQWLQYATAHIEHQITVLRDLIVKLNHGELDLTSPAAQNLAAIKGDVVYTIRGVVEVVGKYAGGALPEPARTSVKAFILSLPARWATVNRPPSVEASGRQGSFGGSPASPSFSSAHISGGTSAAAQAQRERSSSRSSVQSSATRQQQMNVAATTQAANRVLTLAIESLDILRSVTVVFGESLDRADLWVERLRVLGLQRKRAHEQAAAEEAAARIDDGMGGALGSGRHYWENARGLAGGRPGSPSAESSGSMATTASAKRRRTKAIPGARGSHSPSTPGALVMSSQLASDEDEGSQTETERHAGSVRSPSTSSSMTPSFSASGGAGTSSAVASHHLHHHHNNGSLASMRRKGSRMTSSRHHSAKTPSVSNTPVMSELSLHDPPSSQATQQAKPRGGMDLDS